MDYSIFIKEGKSASDLVSIGKSFFGSNGVKIVGLDKDRKIIFTKRTTGDRMFDDEQKIREFFNL